MLLSLACCPTSRGPFRQLEASTSSSRATSTRTRARAALSAPSFALRASASRWPPPMRRAASGSIRS
eukprot:15097380-Alexandrium_andersonii.AAC.1